MRSPFLGIGNFGRSAVISDLITIVTEGSHAIGFGHLRRSVTLAIALRERVRVSLLILSAGTADDLPLDVRMHLGEIPWRICTDISLEEAPVMVLDLDRGRHGWIAEKLFGARRASLALDWFNPEVLPQKTINLLDHSGRMRAAYEGAGRARDYFEGAEYAIIRPRILDAKGRVSAVAGECKVVVTMGGADPGRRTLEGIELLGRGRLEGTIILGPLVPNSYEQEVRAVCPVNFRVVRNPVDFDQYLAAANVVLCSGGGTLLEALCLGRPSVVFPQSDAEKRHAEIYVKGGACVFSEKLEMVLTDETFRVALSERAQERVDGRGVERIVDEAIGLLNWI
jgi:spore coat polysaccharide biosynthesis predicted glycosyltransferase SpsG